MPDSMHNDRAQRLITQRCLIAADVDKTILSQIADLNAERQLFFRQLAPQLVEAANLGANVAFVTGNSIHELCSRVLDFLIKQLAHTNDLPLLSQFHFFCNSGGVYFHFPAELISQAGTESVLWKTIVSKRGNELCVKSKFVHEGYLTRTLVQSPDATAITRILDEAAAQYMEELEARKSDYQDRYDLSLIQKNGQFLRPMPETRTVEYGSGNSQGLAAVQVTLKPVLSFRHAKECCASELFGNDVRTALIRRIQDKLDGDGLDRYVARPGGRGSIDVTLQRLDKAYALEFLIDYLRVEGNPRRGQQFGSNTIYFGDEVIIGGGNDYPVTRIPGLMVFAVNPDKELVPCISPVYVPSAIFAGPEATAKVLTQFNECAHELLGSFSEDQPSTLTAIEALKHRIFTDRIRRKIEDLTLKSSVALDDWQTLHTFVTLMSRDDPAARYWLSLLVKELDGIMTQLGTTGGAAGLGTSYPRTAT